MKKPPHKVPEGFLLVFRRRDLGGIEDPAVPVLDEKIVDFRTRKVFEPKPVVSDEHRAQAAEALTNDLLVEELSMMLQRAQNGELASLSYIALDRNTKRFEWHAIMAVESEESDQHAIRHLGALKMLEETLTDLVYAPDGDEDDDGDYDDDGEWVD